MKRWKVWLAQGLLVVVTTSVALLMAEGAVRLVSPRATATSHQDRYGLPMHYPSITRYLPLHDQTISINSVGMRDREHELAKPEGTYRILVLGDSFMEAYQVAFEESMPHLIEGSLGLETGRSVEVVNGGVSGWGTDDQLRYLTEYGLEYEPDLVVVAMTLHNDVSDNLREYWHTLRDGELQSQERERISFWGYKSLQFKAALSVRSQLVQLFRMVRHGGVMDQIAGDLDNHIVQLFQEPTPERITFGFDLTERLLARMQQVTTAEGADLAVVLLPLKYQLSEEAFASVALTPSPSPDGTISDKPQRIIKRGATELGIPVIDLLPSFQAWTSEAGEPLYLDYDGHWTVAGHRLAADVVTEQLVNGLLSPGAPDPR